jgi:transcriptional regulator with AAA-type ATPase domain
MLSVSASPESTEDDRDRGAPPARPPRHSLTSLTLLFEDGRPRAVPPFRLDDVDAITLGRSSHSGAQLPPAPGAERRLALGIADRRMSQVHAHLRLTDGGWSLEDAGSKNGTRVNGIEVGQATLRSGDLVEVGRSFLLFRSDVDGFVGPAAPDGLVGLATFNAPLARQFERLVRVSRSQVPILVQGDTGTGKELVTQAIHDLSDREGPLRAVNCGALPRSLLESELFGFRKGAFSGADQDRIGLVRSADKGTLFLDEIADLPLDGQAALLRVLQEGEIHPIGASGPISVDVRVVAATHRDLSRMVQQGEFREDLLARLNGFSVTLPPLRDRREDLGALVGLFGRRHAPGRADSIGFSPAAVRALHAHRWPQNIRELEKTVAAALALAQGDLIELEHLPEVIRAEGVKPVGARPVDGGEQEALRRALENLLDLNHGNVSATASAMRTSRMQVHRLCRRFGIDLRRYRPPSR